MITIREAMQIACLTASLTAGTSGREQRSYENKITPLRNATPILADHPEFVEPIRETARFESPVLVNDSGADLDVCAWRYSYNARGVIEIPNRLKASKTAVIVVHPWGVDDGSGWKTPEPAGAAFQCTPVKNALVLKHAEQVVDPFLKRMRGKVGLVAYSLPGRKDPIRGMLYRSREGDTTAEGRAEASRMLKRTLESFRYEGQPLPKQLKVDEATPTIGYFAGFPGLDAGDRYDPKGFWSLPVPVMRTIEVAPEDYVVYDAEGYHSLRDFLKAKGIAHILLAGYNTDMCVCSTTAGYKNLSKDFDVFLVGDATIATFPAQASPRHSTNAAVAFASLNLFITQVSWIRPIAVEGGSHAK